MDPKIAAQLELARFKANQVALRGGLSATAKPGAAAVPSASRTAAELAAERLNAKLGYSKSTANDSDDEGTVTTGAPSGDFIRR